MRRPVGASRSTRRTAGCSRSAANRVMAMSDPDAGKVIATPAIGAGPDGAAFDPGHRLRVQLRTATARSRSCSRSAASGTCSRTSRPSAARGRSPSTKNAQVRVPADGEDRAGDRRPARRYRAGLVQGAGRRQMRRRCIAGGRVAVRGSRSAATRRTQPPPPAAARPSRGAGRPPAGVDHAAGRAAARQAER